MDVREKLIELIMDATNGCARYWASLIADKLLSEGVIVPPFPIGTKYYRIVARQGKFAGVYCVIRKAILNYYNIDNVMNDYGKTVFLTREEAEKALAERSE